MKQRIKKIAFVYSPARLKSSSLRRKGWGTMPPLWALYLGSHLRRSLPGVSIDILDEQLLGPEALENKLRAARYDLAGFSPIFLTYEANLRYARLLKKNGAFVAFGGNYATPLSREILLNRGLRSADHCVDAVVRYDGEDAFASLARGAALSGIPNLAYTDSAGKIAENPVRSPGAPDFPELDYSLVNLEDYFARQSSYAKRVVPFITQRGCMRASGPGRCIFCSIKDRGYRPLPPELLWKRIGRLVKDYGVRGLYDSSADFMGGKDWFREFCAASAACPEKPAMKVALRLDDVTAARARDLRRINVSNAILGVESFDNGVLRRLRKGWTCATAKRGISLLAAAGVIPEMYLLAGAPGESARSLQNTFRELNSLDLPRHAWEMSVIHTMNMIPGTAVWHQLLRLEKGYAGRDIFDFRELFAAWAARFCAAELGTILEGKNAIRRLMALKARM